MVAETPCPIREDLERFMVGQVPESEAQVLEQHLAGCPACLARLEALQPRDQLTAALADVVRRRPAPLGEENSRLLAPLFDLGPGAGGRVAETPPALDGTPQPPGAYGATPDVREAREVLGPPQGPDEIGRLAPYGVLRVLGQGGMGIVFLARQTRPQRLVAVKMILGGRAGREPLTRFRSEAEVVARLQHPNVVQIYEVGEHDGRAYFAMEYVAGGSMADQLATAPLPAPTAARLVRTLAGAMQHAHLRGIVHRDLKPSNILLAGGTGSPTEWLPKVTDFGLAKQLEGEADDCSRAARTASGAILGTPAYMAPEQAVGGKEVGPAVDVYALGAILYECLTGRPPFRAATVLETLEQVRTAEPVPPGRLQPGLPRDLQTICLKCLHKEAARRYTSAAELADDLGRFLDGRPIRARPVSLPERLWRWTWRQPALAALLAVSGLSLAALIAGGLVYNARLRAAVQRAEAKEEEARWQEALTASNFRAARGTLDRMLERVIASPAGAAPAFTELRRDLLQEVLAFYRETHGADDPDPVVRRDTAWALAQAGGIHRSLGQKGPATEHLRRAVALLEGMPPELLPPLWRDRLAEGYIYLGMLAGDAGRPDEHEHAYRRVLAIRRRLVEAEPDNPVWQKGLAQADLLLGTLCQFSGRGPEAEAHYTRAVAQYTRLIEARAVEEAVRADLTTTYVYLGHLYYQTHRPGEAESSFARAEGLLTPLAEAHPENLQYPLCLAPLYITWSDFLQNQGRHEMARQRAGRAVDLAEGVLRHEPRLTDARAHAREAHLKRADACEALGLWAEAVRDWDRVVALDDHPDSWKRRVRRALALVQAGEHARAAAEIRTLAGDAKVPAESLRPLVDAEAKALARRAADLLHRLPFSRKASMTTDTNPPTRR